MVSPYPHSTLSFFGNRFTKINLFLSVFLNLGLWLFLAGQAKNFIAATPLHYNIYFGIDLLGPWYRVFLLPLIGFAFLAVNFLAGAAIYRRERILSYFLATAATFCQGLLIVAAFFIIFINQ